jgi:hypothetical protein
MSIRPPELVKRYFTPVAIFAICILLVAGCLAQSTARGPSNREESLKKFLRNYEGNPTSASERTTRYSAAFVHLKDDDLKDDGRAQVIVYLLSPDWCGSGGCSVLILAPAGESYKIVTRTTITRPPIRVLSTKTNGWHDLGVGVGGGGILRGYEARLRFNGKKYPSNPTVPPAQRLQKNAEGKVVISDDTKSYSSLW